MNHDMTHCADFKLRKCPMNCMRAQLTYDLGRIVYLLPVSWAHLEGTEECKLKKSN